MTKLRFDWRLEAGVANRANFILLLLILFSFPLVLRVTGALSVAAIDPLSSRHTPAFLWFCFVLAAFEWLCFAVALGGIRARGRITFRELIAPRWGRLPTELADIGISLVVLLALLTIGNLFNRLPGPIQHGTAAYRSMVAQNGVEALAFLALALSAGFVEEFVFRGYIQRQCQALCGNTLLASAIQVALFTQGHLYQGWIRLIPVVLGGVLFTAVALWRRSLIPGMIGHGLGDGLVAFFFFARHL